MNPFNRNKDLFLGHYDKPELLKKLEKYTDTPELNWANLGFFIHYDSHYFITPLDVIPFAGTGGDGIHFGFLSDFGTVTNLAYAPIVCVSPTNDPPIKLVAKDLTDFLRLVVTVGVAEFLDTDYQTDDEITQRLQEWETENSDEEWAEILTINKNNPEAIAGIKKMMQSDEAGSQGRLLQAKILKQDFQIEPMPRLTHYIKSLRKARQTKITIKTIDNIGVIYPTDNANINNFDYKIKDTKKIKNYLDNASPTERIKFYREATYHYILSKNFDSHIKTPLIKALRKDGFEREARLLKKNY